MYYNKAMDCCKCGEQCFTFTKFTQDKKFFSKRCGSFSDSKKKKITCDYKEDTFICNVVFPEDKKIECSYSIPKKQDLRTRLEHYIHLYEITNEKNIKTGNVLANINFILKQMNYKLFFDDKESMQNLKKRLQMPPDNIIIIQEFKPVVLVEVPEHLKSFPIKSQEAKKYNKKTYKRTGAYIVRTKKSKHDSDNDSDNDNDSNVDENGGFDIENYDTDDNEDDFYEHGNFSD